MADWRLVESVPDDELWGRYWLGWREGLEVTPIKRVALGPRDHYAEVWWELESTREFEATHIAAMPAPPKANSG